MIATISISFKKRNVIFVEHDPTLPILWSTGVGSEVMQHIAVPMIGGMVSSTILTLVVIPAVYALIKGKNVPA
jgi:Cu/Ag efflux pump CusA